jgi:Mn2+/Fe2+ NRAMP family transporter
MGFSNLIAFFIMLTTAVTLQRTARPTSQTSAQAAAALRPIAGEFAFHCSPSASSAPRLLAMPVLAGSAAYALAGTLEVAQQAWRCRRAAPRASIRIIADRHASSGVAIGFADRPDPARLFWSAVINGVISVPIMA